MLYIMFLVIASRKRTCSGKTERVMEANGTFAETQKEAATACNASEEKRLKTMVDME